MNQTKKYLRIDGDIIEAVEKDVLQSELLFYAENPRIHSIIKAEFGENPSQEQIENKMKSLEHVKMLKASIKVYGGLLEPIYVCGNVVLEGNSRLAAYRILFADDPVKWGKIRAFELPKTITKDQIFSMLGTMHIIGKTDWQPFEQASYLARRLTTSRKKIEAIADELGLTRDSARKFIETYNLMVENDDLVRDKWSYYYELVKNGAIQRAQKSYPHLEIKETILERIKDNKFADAREIRKVGKVMGAKGEVADDAIRGFIDESLTLQEAVELVECDSVLDNVISKIEKFNMTVVNNHAVLRENISDMKLNIELKKLQKQLNILLGLD